MGLEVWSNLYFTKTFYYSLIPNVLGSIVALIIFNLWREWMQSVPYSLLDPILFVYNQNSPLNYHPAEFIAYTILGKNTKINIFFLTQKQKYLFCRFIDWNVINSWGFYDCLDCENQRKPQIQTSQWASQKSFQVPEKKNEKKKNDDLNYRTIQLALSTS